MKKRVKLLTTIASLCLAVALMAFGVYAATASSLAVNSTVSFTSQDIEVIWTYNISGGNLENPLTNTFSTRTDVATGNTNTNTGAAAAYEVDGEDTISFVAEDNNQIIYVFTCQNDANGEVDVAVPTTIFTAKTDGNVTVKYEMGASEDALTEKAWEDTTLAAKGNKVVYKVTLTLQDCTLDCDLTGKTLSGTFNATKG